MTWETAVGVMVVGILFFFLYLANTFKESKEWFHQSVRLFLILLSLWLVVLAGNLCIEFAEENTAGADLTHQFEIIYWVLTYAAWIFTFMLVVYFIFEVVMAFRYDSAKRQEELLGK